MITTGCVIYDTWCERSPSYGKNRAGFCLPCSPYSWGEHREPGKPPRYIYKPDDTPLKVLYLIFNYVWN